MNATACQSTPDAVHIATVRAPLSAFRWVPDNDMEPHRMGVRRPTAPRKIEGLMSGDADTTVALEVANHTLNVTQMAAASDGISTRPVSSFRGVGVAVRSGDGEPVFNLTLVHENPRLSIPLSTSTEAATVAREWQAWAKALNLPLLAVNEDGSVHAELTAMGVVLAERPSPRRRGSALVGRRSRYGRKRRAADVHRSAAR
ncbi:DUF6101 family protein [Acuticoccus sp. I52.16.1]|uniref:DUF6101 family protein n=1 Tax=Acuticoccus sp. I52.16.1 TaxID=2928472 RepID=UPI001FD01A98|nr:DUF6101 family protein [Acuticoccus sp. I52.16.1]UOM36249.1 DUF6101 family protein [Acuticoccus sp. I52.16.1]